MTREQFLFDDKTKDAVIRNIEIIGEAVKNIPVAVRERHAGVDWKAASGMRDKLIHGYFGLSFPIVWETVKNGMPPFKAEIMQVLSKMDNQRGGI